MEDRERGILPLPLSMAPISRCSWLTKSFLKARIRGGPASALRVVGSTRQGMDCASFGNRWGCITPHKPETRRLEQEEKL